MLSQRSKTVAAIAYRVTKHTIPGWIPFHEKERRGFAYETGTHFVHIFGKDHGLWVVSPGLTVTEAKSGTLREWVDRTFGAVDIVDIEHEVGHTSKAAWRPSLYYDDEMMQGLEHSSFELRLAEQSLLLLVQRLDELLHFIEPTADSLTAYSHKARELLILACTEVENYWGSFLKIAGTTAPKSGFTTNDYVKLLGPLNLEDYQITLPRYAPVSPLRPFLGWSAAKPTQSLPWYDAYNKTKHDRASHFKDASLINCIVSVAASLVVFSVRFGPFRLFHGAGSLPAYFNQLFSVELCDCDPKTFYVPLVQLPPTQRADLICFGAKDLMQPWIIDPLKV